MEVADKIKLYEGINPAYFRLVNPDYSVLDIGCSSEYPNKFIVTYYSNISIDSVRVFRTLVYEDGRVLNGCESELDVILKAEVCGV